MTDLIARLKHTISDVVDFPKPGIIFKDLTPILSDATLCKDLSQALLDSALLFKPEAVAVLESRGFWFGVQLANSLGVPCIPIRKAGKLPRAKLSESYSLEYGESILEMHEDAILPGQRVLIHDDLLATGGTVAATSRLVTRAGGVTCGYLFIVQLLFLNARSKLADYDRVVSILDYE